MYILIHIPLNQNHEQYKTGRIQCPFALFCVNRQQFLGVIYDAVVVGGVAVIIVVSYGGDDDVGNGSLIYTHKILVVVMVMNKASNSNYTFYSNGIY